MSVCASQERGQRALASSRGVSDGNWWTFPANVTLFHTIIINIRCNVDTSPSTTSYSSHYSSMLVIKVFLVLPTNEADVGHLNGGLFTRSHEGDGDANGPRAIDHWSSYRLRSDWAVRLIDVSTVCVEPQANHRLGHCRRHVYRLIDLWLNIEMTVFNVSILQCNKVFFFVLV